MSCPRRANVPPPGGPTTPLTRRLLLSLKSADSRHTRVENSPLSSPSRAAGRLPHPGWGYWALLADSWLLPAPDRSVDRAAAATTLEAMPELAGRVADAFEAF